MKKILLLFIFLMPLALFAKFYDGKVIYKSGETVDLQINFPLKTTSKKLSVLMNGKKQKLDADKIAYIVVFLNNGKNNFVFKRGKDSRFDKEGNISTKKKTGIWTLIIKAYDHIIISETAQSYIVKKSKTKDKAETMIAVFDAQSTSRFGTLLSKPDDDLVFFFLDVRKNFLKKSIERSQDYLFSKCANFAETIDYDSLESGNFIHEIAEIYNKCTNTTN